jgi:hypothetical protein
VPGRFVGIIGDEGHGDQEQTAQEERGEVVHSRTARL